MNKAKNVTLENETVTISNKDVCDLCHKEFSSSSLLSLHYVLNHGCKMCNVCSEVFLTLNTFKCHERSAHSQFRCDMCNTDMVTFGEFKSHRSKLHDLYSCFLCFYEFCGKQNVYVHITETHFVSDKGFTFSNDFVSAWDKSSMYYRCNMCGINQEKTAVISHFQEYHHVSVLHLAQRLMAQDLDIVVPGTTGNSGKQTDLPHSLPTCTDCSDLIPLPAHNIICLNTSVCKFCLKCFDSHFSRDDHVSQEHSQFPCMLGCSNKVVFDNEVGLNEHCLTIHDVKQCSFCTSYVRCSDGMMFEHLQNNHKYLRSNNRNFGEMSLLENSFKLNFNDRSINLQCHLCSADFMLEITNSVDLFTHFNFHSISLRCVIIFLEETSTLHKKLKELNNLKKSAEQLVVCKTEPEDEPEDDPIPTVHSKNNCSDEIFFKKEPDSMAESASAEVHCQNSSSNINNITSEISNVSTDVTLLPIKNENSVLEFSDDDNTYCINEQDLNPAIELNELNERSNNLRSRTNGTKKVPRRQLKSKSMLKKSKECSDSSNESVKIEWGSSEEEADKNRNDTDEEDEDENENDEEDDDEEVDDDDEDVDDDEEEDEDEEDDNDSSNNISRPTSILKYDLFNVKAEVDPCEVECVVTDTSDIDTDDELLVELASGSDDSKLALPNDTVNGFKKLLVSKRRPSSLNSKSLPGLNRMEVGIKGFYCEICDGKFDPHEGMRELIKHMKTLHGFNCNFNGQKLSTVFKFNKSKSESSIKMQPGLVCPVCMMGWMSKRLLREHVIVSHGSDWIKTSPSGPLAYQCRHCHQFFWRASECHSHEREQHAEISIVQCHVCSETVLRKVSMNRHLKVCHPKEKLHSYISYKCKQCLRLFPTFKLLDQHVRTWHPSCVVFRCPHCHSPLKNKKSLYDHIKTQHRVNQTYQCEECGRTLYSKRALSIHTQLKHHQTNKLRFKCRLCEKFFESKDARKTHYRIDHAQENIFHCRECGKGFASKSGLYGHKQVHLMSIDAFKCEHCNKEFSRRDSYNEHLQIHTGPRHRCPHCGKEFVQRSNMIRHIRIHTGEKPYKCSHCDKTFSDKGACNAHIRVHTREEVSPCPYCGKTFSKKQKLKYHIRKHTGEGLVVCEVCGKSFTHNFLLKEHRLIHDQQTQSLCGECGRAFNSSKYLLRHIQAVHQPTHIYTCPVCAKTFTQQPRLKQHMMTHATYKRLQCQICEKGYTTLNSLRKHLTSVHELKKDNPEYKEMFERLSSERAAFLEFQKQIDLHPFMEGTPIDKLPKCNDRKEETALTGDEGGGSSEAISSSIGQRILRKDRKSRPKCLEELEVESSSSDDDYTSKRVPSNNKIEKWDENSLSLDSDRQKKDESEYTYVELLSDTEENEVQGSLKNMDKSSKKRRVESIARVLKGRKTNKPKTSGSTKS
ncbi:uncharacterized protein LOC142323327 [Lycorma delicatula]|uniref:uncharacterized protein LOC142323327 n=1 Tax=Lycorma delicatula TaxID=130591 RepID=UPI003F51640C